MIPKDTNFCDTKNAMKDRMIWMRCIVSFVQNGRGPRADIHLCNDADSDTNVDTR